MSLRVACRSRLEAGVAAEGGDPIDRRLCTVPLSNSEADMSLMDIKRTADDGVPGLDPPSATPTALWHDLRWHARVYALEGLGFGTRAGFLALRVLQRVAYNRGWYAGGAR